MRILHTADLHLGMVTHSWPDPATGLPSRLLDTAGCWAFLVDAALERQVDAVIVAGDVFHTANPDAAALALFAAPLQRLVRGGIPTLLLAGNHERAPHPGRPCVLEAFAGRSVVVATKPRTYVLSSELTVAALPSVSRHQMMSADFAGRSVLEADQELVEGLRSIIGSFYPDEADVLTGHWPVAGSVIGAEADIAIIPEPMLSPGDLDGPWRYVAMGHIHRSQTIETPDHTPGAYAGSIDRMNFGEETYTPGAWIVDLDGGEEFIPTPARRFVTIAYTGEGFTGGGESTEGAIVRVLDCPEAAVPQWREELARNGAALVRIQIARERQEIVRAAGAAEAPSPLEALDIYLDHRDIDEDVRPRVRARAEELVRGAA